MAERTDWIDFVPVFTDEPDGPEITIELVEPGPPPPQTEPRITRILGWLAICVGVVGVVLGLVLAWLGLGFVDRAATTLDDGLTVADSTLGAILDTLDVVDRTIATTAESLLEMQTSLGSVGGSIRRVDGLLGETGEVVAGDLADSIDSLLRALPGLVDVGDTLDRTLRSLAFLGVPYDPDQPIGDGFREMESALADVPERLRLQGRLIDDMRSDLSSTGASLERVRGDVGEIRSELDATSTLLARYRSAADDGTELVADVRRQVESAAPLARTILAVLGAFVVLYQVVPIWFGWRLTRGDRLVRSDQSA